MSRNQIAIRGVNTAADVTGSDAAYSTCGKSSESHFTARHPSNASPALGCLRGASFGIVHGGLDPSVYDADSPSKYKWPMALLGAGEGGTGWRGAGSRGAIDKTLGPGSGHTNAKEAGGGGGARPQTGESRPPRHYDGDCQQHEHDSIQL